MNVQGALKWNKNMKGLFEDEDGRPLSHGEAVVFLTECMNEGKRVIPISGIECEGWSHDKGCPGHPTGHTPGPWTIDDTLNELNEDYDGQDIIISKEGCPIVTVRGTDDMSCMDDDEEIERVGIEVQANAVLVASAPDMLHALKEAYAELKFHNWHNTTTGMLIERTIKEAQP